MKFRPCIDLHAGKVKQIIGSTYIENSEKNLITNFVAQQSPAYFAELYKSDNLFGGHVIMLGKGNGAAAKEALSAFPGGLQIGGGINADNAKVFIESGASHVIVTSYVFKDGLISWDKLNTLNRRIGRKRLVLDLSCRKKDGTYYIMTDHWQKFTDTAISEETLSTLSLYCDEFLVHAVDVEGKQGGVDSALVHQLSGISPIPITYAGGIRSLNDLELFRIEGKGMMDVTIGSALDIFGGPLHYKNVVAWFKKDIDTV